MELTGKCLNDFSKWIKDKYDYNIIDFSYFLRILKNALIIEFFDVKGIFMDRLTHEEKIQIWDYRSSEPDNCIEVDLTYYDRSEHFNAGFEKANEIYNS